MAGGLGAAGAMAAFVGCGVSVAYLMYRCRELRTELEHCEELRAAERRGRTEAEKKLRQLRKKFQGTGGSVEVAKGEAAASALGSSEADESYPMRPIGYMRTCFSRRSGTPRQPHLVPAAKGLLKLKTKLPKDIMSGLQGYSHCWILYIFHENTNLGTEWERMKGKVQVPRLDGGRVGVLATRSPHRPNAIGLSSAKIDSVQDKCLIVSGLDLVDGSPVLDIKPYVPFCDVIESAATPAWVGRAVEHEPLHISSVVITDKAMRKLRFCWDNLGKSGDQAGTLKELYNDFGDLVRLLNQVLGRDIRSVYQRTSDEAKRDPVVYHLHLLGCIDVEYVVEDTKSKTIEILDAHLRLTGHDDDGGRIGREVVYYEAIAEEVSVSCHEDLRLDVLQTFERVWSSPKATLCFSLVTYKYLLGKGHRGKKRDKYTRVLLTGMRHLFWSDLHTEAKRFRSLFGFLSDDVVLSDGGLDKLSSSAQLECAQLVARFSLYYFGPRKVAQTVYSFPASASVRSLSLDFFLKEIAGVLRKIKVEGVIITYLSSLVRLHELIPFSTLSLATTARVQEVLFTLSQPGGPYYAPKAVRVQARNSFSKIYPHGKRMRALFKILTSILHPAYSVNAMLSNISTLLGRICSTWPWERLGATCRDLVRRVSGPRGPSRRAVD
ncbi:tRNA (adenine(37)-N6)-methyltransferase [Chloropicon primus]|uniref:tRNA (Adenine(37)-N6)-methyltransferase n=2 Tax=Chloropicon primus TaxID=1764295 RepID=A0A5B8MWE6_9CHLO|nr:tRNA (adenine(37)-N6)-methyltransferase [Chloropicon primus]|eukprot:QDZ24757.1 tRNA (adenine(37)-N6)-methyltransferase [Chloropicon primus]